MNGLQPVPRVRQCPVHDGREGIGKIPLSDRAAQWLGHLVRGLIGIIQKVAHGASDSYGRSYRKAASGKVSRNSHKGGSRIVYCVTVSRGAAASVRGIACGASF